MISDLTFITNQKNEKLLDRFKVLVKDTRFFDVLVGYFYVSGFYALYKSLEPTEKIRILIGVGTSQQSLDLIKIASNNEQQLFQFSHSEVKQKVENLVQKEMEDSEDNKDVEEGVVKFIEWIQSKKLEIRAYPSQNIHAKLYIMTFTEKDRDIGRVITGSSNFTRAGLVDNLEFNVELKNRADYEFAKQKFEELWEDAVDIGEKYIQTIQTKTWLNKNITPYELYLKFLYEYFKDELNLTDEIFIKYLPQDFKKFEYQKQAVLNAKKILEEYGGVFISDVVGLGKTYIPADFESVGKIDVTTEEHLIIDHRRGRDSRSQVLKILKATLGNSQRFTDEQEDYLKRVITRLEEGAIPKQTTKRTLKALNDLKSDLTNPLKVLATLQHTIPERLLKSHYAEYPHRFSGKREVILSLYLAGGKKDENS
ncbi:hypothetical protein J7K28_03215 [Candidatus Aerophobetes bacterium]|nr:hypothetical protein [Candidatus Aerophobetes bacterium]